MVISPPRTGSLLCPTCGTPKVPGARFCFNCGMRFAGFDPIGPDSADRRVVTVLFGDLSDFTSWAEDRDPERVGDVTDRVLAALAHEVKEVGGRVDSLTGDGIMAVFGAPTAHEDDPERAVRAAAAMQETARRLILDEAGDTSRLGLRVGVNTGEVLAGVQAALSYTVIGDTVNTAARLSDAAAVGTVYAGRETVMATRSVATWRELRPLALKGKREPVAAYELVSLSPSNVARPGLADDAAFIGRRSELVELTRAFTDVVEHGRPRVAVVTGEAGIGKTRLARELADPARLAPGTTVLWGRTVRHGDGRDLAPLVDIVRTACGVTDGDSLDRVAHRVRRTVAGLAHPATGARLPTGIADRLLGLLGVPPDRRPTPSTTVPSTPPGDPVSRTSPGEAPQRAVEATVDAVGLLLAALADRGPLLVVVDDLEWATSRLAEALRRLARTVTGPLLLLLLDREGPQFAELDGALRLALGSLPEDAARTLLEDYLGGEDLSEQTRSKLLARVHGNPFFLTELLNLLVDRGLLSRETDTGGGVRWVLEESLAESALPAGVQSVLAARIDDLDASAKAVLRAAAVLGTSFSADALQVVSERSFHEVKAALQVLAERQLVRPTREGEPLWRFVHPMARDVAYAGLPKVERARRHATAARWGVTAMVGSSREVSTFVATHALRAYDLAASMALPATDPAWSAREAGFHAHVRLARAALARDDHRGAAELLAGARRLGKDVIEGDDDVNVRILHAEALVWLRRLDEAERTLRPALRVNASSRRAAAYAVLGELRQKQGRGEEATQSLLTALDAAHRAGDDRAVAAALRRLGLLEYAAGRIQAAEERYRGALALARRVDDTRGVGWALQHLAWSATTRGDYVQAERTLREASAVFERLEDADGLGWCSGTEALVLLLSGQLTRARRVARALMETAESMRESWGIAVCLTIDAVAAAELGDIETAEQEATRAASLFMDVGDTLGTRLTMIARGLAARGAGRPRQGADFLAQACDEATSTGHVLIGAFASVLLGLTQLDAGEIKAAEDAARRAKAHLDGLELRPHAQLGTKVLEAQIARARGRLGEATAGLCDALSASEPATLMFPRRQAYAHLAGTLLDAGEPVEALRIARKAVSVDAEDVRARVLAYRALGTALVANGDIEGAREAYQRALDAATATGAVSEEPQTRRLLAALPDATEQPAVPSSPTDVLTDPTVMLSDGDPTADGGRAQLANGETAPAVAPKPARTAPAGH